MKWKSVVLTVLLLLVGVCGLWAETINPSDFSRKMLIAPNYTGTVPLTNFPLLVTFSEGADGFSYDKFESADYSDLRFTEVGSTSTIPYEVESWNAAPATPDIVNGCSLWLRADVGVQTSVSGVITNWIDQSGKNHPASIDGTNGAPVLVNNGLNGLPVVRFDGTKRYLIGQSTTARTIFAVTKVDTNAVALAGLFCQATGKDAQNIRTENGTWNAPGNAVDYHDFCDNGRVTINGRNGWEHHNQFHVLMEEAAANRTFTYQIGQTFLGRYYYGDLAELIVFNRKLSESEIRQIGTYLEEKYGLDTAYGRQSAVWLQVPVLTSDTELEAYWGNTNLTTIPSYATNGTVWSADYAAVLHMADSGAIGDASGGGHTGVGSGVTNGAGTVSGGCSFDDGDQIVIADDAALRGKDTTMSLWFSGSYSAGNEAGMLIDRRGNSGGVVTTLDASPDGSIFIQGGGGNLSPNNNNSTVAGLNNREWHHLAVTYPLTAGATGHIFVDGSQVGTLNVAADWDWPTNNIELGRSHDTYWKHFVGVMDEFRVSTVLRSDEWIKASYASQSDPVAFNRQLVDAYWDTSTVAGLQGGNGVWNTTNQMWNYSATGSELPQSWSDDFVANFTATGGSSVVSIGSISAKGVVFGAPGYSIQGTKLNLNEGGIRADADALITAGVALDVDQVWQTAAGKTLTVSGAVDTAGNTLTVGGSGTVTLKSSSAGSHNGDTVVESGTLRLAIPGGNGNFGTYPAIGFGTLTIKTGATVICDDLWQLQNGLAYGQQVKLNIMGGTLDIQNSYVASPVAMTGGQIMSSSSTDNQLRFNANPGKFVINAATNTAVLDGCRIHNYNNSTPATIEFDVADGSQDVDLLCNALLWDSPDGHKPLTVLKTGGGTMKITSECTYTGGTEVRSGLLLVDNVSGSGTGTNDITLNGGMLGGVGTVSGAVVAGPGGGFIAPGESGGTLTVGGLNLHSASLSGFYVDLESSSAYGQLAVNTGGVDLGNGVLTGEVNFAPASNAVFYILLNYTGSAVSNTFNGVAQGGTVDIDGYTFNVSYTADATTASLSGGDDVALYNPRPASGGGGGTTPVGPPYWRKISFPGYNRSAVLTNFPALVELQESMDYFSFSNFISSVGSDLRFFSDTNKTTELQYEIESWDTNTAAYVWVKIPELTTNTAIWAYWGDSSMTNSPSYTTNGAVWDSGYMAVWHLADSVGDQTDSTTNSRSGTPMNGVASGSGIIGPAALFDGVDDWIDIPNNFGQFADKPVTISLWMNTAVIDGANRIAFGAGGEHNLFLTFGDTLPSDTFGLRINDGIWRTPVTMTKLTDGRWYHVTVSWDPVRGYRMYRDGVLCAISSRTTVRTVRSGDNTIGCLDGSWRFFKGMIDEVRVSDIVRSSDWIWASAQNQKDPLAFMGEKTQGLYWDIASTIGLQSGSGDWDDGVTSTWSDDAVWGSLPLLTWSNAAATDAHFSAYGGGTVTLTNGVQAAKAYFEAAGYTLQGGTLALSDGVVAMENATIKTPFTITAPQVWYVASGKTLTVDGAGWNIAHTLVKRGAGTLRFINYKYSYCPSSLDIAVEEGLVKFDQNYWWQGDATDAMRIQVMPGASLYTATAAFGFIQWPSDGSLLQAIIDGGTWTMAGNMGFPGNTYDDNGRLVLRGADLLGGQIHPMYGTTLEVKASDVSSHITSSLRGQVSSGSWTLTVEDGAADPDVLLDGAIGSSVAAITKNGTGKAVWTAANSQGATTINAGTVWLNNTAGSGAGSGDVTVNGGTLGGNGSMTGAVLFGANGGTLAPGAPTGELTVGGGLDCSGATNGVVTFDAVLNSATNSGSVKVTGGSIVLTNAVLNVELNYASMGDDKHFIINNATPNAVVGVFSNVPHSGSVLRVNSTTPGAAPYVTVYYGADADTGELTGGNDVAVVVPAPGMLFLLR